MAKTLNCPSCDTQIDLLPSTKVGAFLVCPKCGLPLDLVSENELKVSDLD